MGWRRLSYASSILALHDIRASVFGPCLAGPGHRYLTDSQAGAHSDHNVNQTRPGDVFNSVAGGAINSRTGEFYPKSGPGLVNPRNGVYSPQVPGGYVNPKTGFNPSVNDD